MASVELGFHWLAWAAAHTRWHAEGPTFWAPVAPQTHAQSTPERPRRPCRNLVSGVLCCHGAAGSLPQRSGCGVGVGRARWAERGVSGPPSRVLGTGHPAPGCTGAPARGWVRAPRATFRAQARGCNAASEGPLRFVVRDFLSVVWRVRGRGRRFRTRVGRAEPRACPPPPRREDGQGLTRALPRRETYVKK